MDNQEIYLNQGSVDISKYWDMLNRRIWVLLGVIVISYSGLMIHLSKEVPQYKSSSLVRISRQNIVSSIVDEGTKEVSFKSYIQTQIQIINSKSVNQQVRDSLNSQEDTKNIKDSYRVKVRPLSNTSLISISVVSTHPELTARVANLIPSCYMEIVRKNQRISSDESLQWLFGEIESHKNKIMELHTKLEHYNSLGGFVEGNSNIGNKSTLGIQKEESERKYIQAKLNRLDLEHKYKLTKEFLKKRKADTFTIPPYLNNDLINNLLGEYSKLTITISEKKNFYGDKHPIMLELNSKIHILKNNLNAALKLRMKEFFQEKEYAISNEEMYQANLAEIEAEINSRKSNEFEKAKLRDEITNSKKIYNLMLKKSKEMEILSNSDLTKFSIVDLATVPGGPFKPEYVKQSILNFLISLLLGFAIIYLLEVLDTKVTNFEKAKQLNAPYIGEIELSDQKTDGRIIDINQKNQYFKESIKAYIVNMQYMLGDHRKLKKLMFTSTIPKEGKTFTIINMLGFWLRRAGFLQFHIYFFNWYFK